MKSRLFGAVCACTAFCLVTYSTTYAASFMGLGNLPSGGRSGSGFGVSDDGSVVAGIGDHEAFLWSQLDGMVGLGSLSGGTSSAALGISGDGLVVVGQSTSASGNEAFRWTQGGGMVSLGVLPDGLHFSAANGASADGSVVVGESMVPAEAFRWTQSDGMVGLGDLPGGSSQSRAFDVSADGSVVVGDGTSTSGTEAFRWTEREGLVPLGDLPGGGFASIAFGVSHDGSVVVGSGWSAEGVEAFRWTPSGGMVGLGALLGGEEYFSRALSVSGDGSVVVGVSQTALGQEAFVWDQKNGIQRLETVLENQGIDLTGWMLFRANDISADGRTVVGQGRNPDGFSEAWAAQLDPPVQVVSIDIKPGSDPNCFNKNGHGVIPVAILGAEDFDVNEIDLASLSFGGLEVRVRGNKGSLCSIEYSNEDAYLDLVCHFEDDSSAWETGDGEATLTGNSLDGTLFEGTDSICVVP